jgi:hypothetical protein
MDIEEEYARACYAIERLLHKRITPDYPCSTFIEEANFIKEEQKESRKSIGNITKTLG